jgi:hypothetical protein
MQHQKGIRQILECQNAQVDYPCCTSHFARPKSSILATHCQPWLGEALREAHCYFSLLPLAHDKVIRVLEEAHPGACFAGEEIIGTVGELHGTETAFRMRHQNGGASVYRGEAR